MKISKIESYNKPISFGIGKVALYSDFDATYFPSTHDEMRSLTSSRRNELSNYCSSFKNFFSKTRDGLNFHITTGRTLGEYQSISELIKDNGLEIPLPDTIIAKNGSDEYIRCCTDEDFYRKGLFPFRYDKTNKEKEKRIRELTGWDGPKLKDKLKELFKSHDLRIVEGDSEHGVKDYKTKSLFSQGKIPYESHKYFYGSDKPDWVVGLRNDGNCKLFITYPSDMESNPERKAILNSIKTEFEKYERELGVKIHKYQSINPRECDGRLCAIYEPLVDSKLKSTMEKVYDQGLTKLFDTKEAVKKAIKNKDLVIVAGDSSNDYNMLNPLLYLDIPELSTAKKAKFANNSGLKLRTCWQEYITQPSGFIKELDPNNPLHKEIIEQLDNLPFIGIVVKKKGGSSPLSELSECFGSNSKFHKIITVEDGHLEDGIREAIKLHAKSNPEYMKKLSPDLKKEIFGIIDDIEPKNISAIKKIFNGKNIALAAIATGILVGILLFIKNKKSSNKIQKTTNNLQFFSNVKSSNIFSEFNMH